VEKAQVRLSYLLNGDTYYCMGANFSSGTVTDVTAWNDTYAPGGSTTTWDYMQDIVWPAGDKEYKLEVRSIDASRLADDSGQGNIEVAPYVTRHFIVDNTPPTVAITTPTAAALNAISYVMGTVDASLSGHKQTEIRVSTGSSTLSYWKHGTGWQSDANTCSHDETLRGRAKAIKYQASHAGAVKRLKAEKKPTPQTESIKTNPLAIARITSMALDRVRYAPSSKAGIAITWSKSQPNGARTIDTSITGLPFFNQSQVWRRGQK